jgi:AraC family transcriptional activator of mtrCDE
LLSGRFIYYNRHMSAATRLREPAPSGRGPSRRASEDPDKLVHWLLGSLELETTVFHVGQYCGNWRASTAGRALASYHLVLRGRCFVHVEGQAPLELGPRDGIFFLRDVPHFLSPDPSAATPCVLSEMQPLAPSGLSADEVGLACGFFHFRGALSEVLIGGLPHYLVIRSDAEGLAPTRVLFDLILAEAGHPPGHPSPLVARLSDLLFFYVLRHVAREDASSAGLWSVVRRPEFAALVQAIIEDPAKDWTIEAMARASGMSRASFFKHFVAASGKAPAKFVLLLRMRIAAERLRAGESTTSAADHVGYQSIAAFSRAFKKVIGEAPSAYRRATSG